MTLLVCLTPFVVLASRSSLPVSIKRYGCWCLVIAGVLVGVTRTASAQATVSALPVAIPPLSLKVGAGEGDQRRPGVSETKPISVVVLNELELPQPEAKVTFIAPKEGPTVLFAGESAEKAGTSFREGVSETTVTTDRDGVASVNVIRGTNQKGPLKIRVLASFEGKTAETVVNQVIVSPPFWTKPRIVGFSTAAGATAIVLWQVLKPGPLTGSPGSASVSPLGTRAGVHIYFGGTRR